MARAVKLARGKEFNFVKSTATGAVSKYPWTEWFDGGLLLIERSDGVENDKGTIEEISAKRDYEVSTNAMMPKLVTAARRKYKIVQISRVDEHGKRLKDALIIRARDMTPEERVEEDKQRVEDKIKAKTRRAAGASTNGQAGHDVVDDTPSHGDE